MTQHDPSRNTFKSRSSLNPSQSPLMLQPKLLNNAVVQPTGYTTHQNVSGPNLLLQLFLFYKHSCCLHHGYIWLMSPITGCRSTILFIFNFYHLWQMVIYPNFLKVTLAAEFQITSKLSKSEATWSSVIFTKVIFITALTLCLQVCTHANITFLYIVFWCLEVLLCSTFLYA